ncbi:MAG TPA: endoribonuclease MazF [Allosphingosinicella sp.]|uniref:endoribonuclease MazF n=1 Tax=Allosphingosinicella sp. TaxID=2823234 RepID=UPI002F282BCB
MTKRWVPEAGDIIWIEFDPQAGHEQAGHRPALVLSPAEYNGLTGLLLCVPMTTRTKGYKFEVAVAGKRGGVALADQVKSFDWGARRASKKGRASDAELEAIRARVRALVG